MCERREALAWVAGFFDGEGSTIINGGQPALRITQKNRALLDRVVEVLGFGKVYGPYIEHDKYVKHQLCIEGLEKTQAALVMLWPWLGLQKRDQALSVLVRHRQHWLDRRCKTGTHFLNRVDRIRGGCGPCYRVKHPATAKVAF